MSSVIDDRRGRYLYEAVTTGSVRAAGDKLDMNPSVVSRQIAKLEEELAIPLLERHGRGVKPTEAGQMLVDYHRQHVSYQDDVVSKVQELRGLERGHIDLVLGEGFVSDLMAEPLQGFWRRYPGLTVTLSLAGTNEVLRRVAEDTAHIGLVYNPPVTPGIRSRAAIRQPMCVITTPAASQEFARVPRGPDARVLRDATDRPVGGTHGSPAPGAEIDDRLDLGRQALRPGRPGGRLAAGLRCVTGNRRGTTGRDADRSSNPRGRGGPHRYATGSAAADGFQSAVAAADRVDARVQGCKVP